MNSTSRPVTAWWFTDGKPGHENQTLGLLAALRERVPVDEFTMHTGECRKGLLACITGHDPFGEAIPDPDLIIGAGHATHLPMLNARRIRGGRVVVLMKPTLPGAWFDLCVIPAHDHPRHADNVLVTQGVLNRIRRSDHLDAGRGLVLVGGPSPHVRWSSERVVAQIRAVLAASPGIRWTLATSRRTPDGFLEQLAADAGERLVLVAADQTTPDWLPQQLAVAATVWVSADSVSMIYEALGSGAAVGLLSVPCRKSGDRLRKGIDRLLQARRLTDFGRWQAGSALHRQTDVLDEAGRCADWIVSAWLGGR